MISAETWKKGITDGLRTSATLLKVILPVFAVVNVLEHTPVIGLISHQFDPLMRFIGLPGEAALAVVTGMLFNFYAALGIILALGANGWVLISARFLLASLAAIAVALLLRRNPDAGVVMQKLKT